ncbi:MAG TPA: STAS domain-containing protein [Miltoncostaeaceae bacterium]|nr:STAS domain-containing protein [Miltoncostaeaceae bacterium]
MDERAPATAPAGPADTVADVPAVDIPSEGPLQVSRSTHARALVIRLVGELDLAGAPTLASAVTWAAEDSSDLPLVLDMAEVTFIDSTGVRTLLEASQAANRPIALLTPSTAVTRVLDLTRLRGRFLEVDDLESADLVRR